MALKVKRPERLVEVCLDGALVAEYEAVEAELENKRRERVVDKRMNDPIVALERRKGELWLAQKAEMVVFRLRALPRSKWSEIKLGNPPRKDNSLDEHYGFNTETTFDAAMAAEGTIVEVTQGGEPTEFTGEDWADFSADLTVGQFAAFQVALNEMNGGHSEVPFSPTGYKMIQDSDAKSK